MELTIYFITGFVVGSLSVLILLVFLERLNLMNLNYTYTEVFNRIKDGKSTFISRINNVVNIELSLKKEGKVNVMYWLDNNEISIFKNDKCLYVSSRVNNKLVSKISNTILKLYHNKINNTVDKKTLAKMSKKTNIDDLFGTSKVEYEPSLDDLLDRINLVGYDNLSDSEKEILKKYGNGK